MKDAGGSLRIEALPPAGTPQSATVRAKRSMLSLAPQSEPSLD